MRGGAADIESRRFQDAGVFAEIVLRGEIHVDGNSGRRATGDQKRLGKLDVAFGLRFAALGGEIGIQIHDSAETHGRIEETRGGKIQARDVELGVERSE